MNSISRAFFFSLGTVMFLVLGLFWVALAFDFSALENFLLHQCNSLFIGFTIPQILGAEFDHSVVEQVFRLKIVYTVVVVLYGALFYFVGTLKTKWSSLQYLCFSIVIPLSSFLLYIWVKLIHEDHILLHGDKVELFQFTIISFITVIGLTFLSLKKDQSSFSNTLPTQIPSVDDLKNDFIDSTETSLASDSKGSDKDPSIKSVISEEEQVKEEISSGVKDETPDIKGASGDDESEPKEEADGVEVDLPSPTQEELPSDEAVLQQEDEQEFVTPDSDEDELPPPLMDELPADLADLQVDKEAESREPAETDQTEPKKETDS